ncbi:hypothetical protein TWF718_000250 [Orbilia javanica]|uniref:Uncharacterized protein n=1 Tax=Orbilia javanica TaxID=47235 RepID=A0AAN8N449_9PEZI
MGRAFSPKKEIVENINLRWKVYRPVESETAENEALRTTVYVANGEDPTFSRLEPKIYFERISSTGFPIENTVIKKYIGDFMVTEVTTEHEEAYDDDVLREGDFLVLEGGNSHIQVCFQEMTRRSYDGSFRPDVRASYLEIYSGNKPGRRRDVVGCVEVVFRIYRNLPFPRISPGEPDGPEQPLLTGEMLEFANARRFNPENQVPVEDLDPPEDRILIEPVNPPEYYIPIESFGPSENRILVEPFGLPENRFLVQDFNPLGESQNALYIPLYEPGEEGQEGMAMSPRFGGTESEIPSIPVSYEIQQGSRGGSPVPYGQEQSLYEDGGASGGTGYEEYSHAPGQLEDLRPVRAETFGTVYLQPSGLDILREPVNFENRRLEFFAPDDEEFNEANVPDIMDDIEDLVDQLNPEENRIEMEIEQERGIWADDFPENPFRELGDASDYLAELNDERDMGQWGRFGENIVGILEEDDDYTRYQNFIKENEGRPSTEGFTDNLSSQGASRGTSQEINNEDSWVFPTTAEEKPGRLHPAQYVEVHDYFSSRAGDPRMRGGRWIDAQLMLKRLQLGKFDQVPNDIKYLMPGNPDLSFEDTGRPRPRPQPRPRNPE